MFADSRHSSTEAADRIATAAMSARALRGSRHAAAASAITPVTAAVSAMCPALNVVMAEPAAATVNVMAVPFFNRSVEQDAEYPGGGHDVGFGDLLEPPQQRQGDHGDSGGDPAGDGLAGQDDHRAAQGAARCRRGAGDERLDLAVGAVPDEPAAGNDHAQVDRGEDGDGGDERPGRASHEVADERGGDDDRPRGDQAHRDGVEELRLGEPVVLGDDAVAQQRHDGQPGPEDQGAGLEEEKPQRDQHATRGESAQRRRRKWQYQEPPAARGAGVAGARRAAAQGPGWTGFEEDQEQARADDEVDRLTAGGGGDGKDDRADGPGTPR